MTLQSRIREPRLRSIQSIPQVWPALYPSPFCTPELFSALIEDHLSCTLYTHPLHPLPRPCRVDTPLASCGDIILLGDELLRLVQAGFIDTVVTVVR